jgi:hypothetical protein
MILFPKIIGMGLCLAQYPGCASRRYGVVALYRGQCCLPCYRIREQANADEE